MMGPSDIFTTLFEYGPESLGQPLFARQGMPRSLAADDFRPYVLRRGLNGQSGSQWFFTESGRPFTLYVVLGSHIQRGLLVPRANDLIGACRLRRTRRGDPTRLAPRIHGRLSNDGPVRHGTDRRLPHGLGTVGGRGGESRPSRRHGPGAGRGVPPPPRPVQCRCGSGRSCEAGLGDHRAGDPATLVAGLVALSYVVVRRIRGVRPVTGGAIASCGCFGTPDTPATPGPCGRSTGSWPCLRPPWPASAPTLVPSSRSSPISRGAGVPLVGVSAPGRVAGLLGHLGIGRPAGGSGPRPGSASTAATTPR